MNTKKCSECKVTKGLSFFGKRRDSKDGRTGKCKTCLNKRTKEYRSGERDSIIKERDTFLEKQRDLAVRGKRRCSCCLKTKIIDCFYTDKHGRLSSYCILCSNSNNKKTYKLHKAERLFSKQEYYKTNSLTLKQKRKDYYKDNHDKVITGNRQWRLKNREKCKTRNLVRYQNIKNATPPWLTDVQILEIELIYAKCKEISRMTGVLHHVDHMFPVGYKDVSGLHVPWNLQILTASDNSAKGVQYDCSQGLAYQ